MATYRGPVCRLCRREGLKLYLKGERCFKESCAIEKRNFPPGQHGQGRRSKIIGYGLQLREKQKVRRIYGVLERQFQNYFEKASRQRGVTGENLLTMLERRLDNAVYRLGFASSRAQSRQLVGHGHILVNSSKVNIPSFQIKPGDVVSVKEKSQKVSNITAAVEMVGGRGVPDWLELDSSNYSGKVLTLPKRDNVNLPVQERMIVEFYSK
ncbi:MAG: 30S ribosomal protein S4 [Acidobacteriia bacterium]|nr:30S ribosomal protein S4 [Terriglobia bacterium]